MTHKVGIIGTGFGARVHAPILQQHPAFDVVALSGVHRKNGAAVAAEMGIPRGYDSWRDMLNKEALDVVVIASNPAWHAEMTLAALAKGIHVLCEKPPALNLSQAQAMRQTADQSKAVTAMNFEWRFLPERQVLKQLVQSGRLGSILHVHWREVGAMWPSLLERPHSWLWETSSGGGFLGAIGSHMIDSLNFWFGRLAWVQGHTQTHVFARPGDGELKASDADDSFYFHGEFAQGGSFTVEFTVTAVNQAPQLEIHGTSGTAVFDGTELHFTEASGNSETLVLPERIDPSGFESRIHGYVHPQWKLYDAFAETLGGTPVADLPTFTDAAHVQAVLDAIRASNQAHRQPVL